MMSRMAAAPHRSVTASGALRAAKIADGTCNSHILTTSSMNATRWQGLYRMVNKNRHLSKMLAIALTGSEGGEQDMEEEAHDEDGDDDEEEEEEEEDHDNDEVLQDADSDEEHEQANESANKKFPFAHRLLDDIGFQNNPLLENVLSSANEVSGLVQKQEGMGLSVGYQMAKVLKDEVTSMRFDGGLRHDQGR